METIDVTPNTMVMECAYHSPGGCYRLPTWPDGYFVRYDEKIGMFGYCIEDQVQEGMSIADYRGGHLFNFPQMLGADRVLSTKALVARVEKLEQEIADMKLAKENADCETSEYD